MEEKRLEVRAYPKMVQEFARANFDLKVLSGALLILSSLSLLLAAFLLRRGPQVIALDAGGEIAKLEKTVTEPQVTAAIREYLSRRYTFDSDSVAESIKRARFFVSSNLVTAFDKALAPTIKYVREKKVRQRVYPISISIDSKEQKALVHADRITEFDGLKAATEMTVQLWFSVEERSILNPWGVYLTKEQEGGGK